MSITKVTSALVDSLDATKLTGTIADARLGTVSVSKGGTGATTHTANNVLVGNGTSAIASVAPSTSGNVLTSNGTAWTSAAAAGGGKILQIVANSNGVTTNINSTSNSDAGFDVSITPTSASSKIMVFGTFTHGQDDGPAGSLAVALIYKDDTTAIEEMTIGYEATEAAPSYTAFAISALDGPVGSTTTIKYSIYARTSDSTSQFRFSNTAGTFWAIEFDPS